MKFVYDVRGHHFNIFEDGRVEHLSSLLKACCRGFELRYLMCKSQPDACKKIG
jgi:hypothetical protein